MNWYWGENGEKVKKVFFLTDFLEVGFFLTTHGGVWWINSLPLHQIVFVVAH